MGARVFLLERSAVRPPPWMTNPGTTRWKTVPSKKPSSTYRKKFSTVTGASFGNSSTVKAPCEVSNLIIVVLPSYARVRRDRGASVRDGSLPGQAHHALRGPGLRHA